VGLMLQQRKKKKRLQPQDPVPSEIAISQQIVREVGLLSMEDVAKE